MQNNEFGIFGWGLYLPKAVSIEEMVKSAGGDPETYLTYGWHKACVANENEHPNSMVFEALKKALVAADITPEQLNIVISTAEAHDYLEMSTAMEVMREFNLSPTTITRLSPLETLTLVTVGGNG